MRANLAGGVRPIADVEIPHKSHRPTSLHHCSQPVGQRNCRLEWIRTLAPHCDPLARNEFAS